MVDPTVVAPQRSPFRPLDPAVITPTFKYFKRAPCTFAPKKYKSKRSLLKDNTGNLFTIFLVYKIIENVLRFANAGDNNADFIVARMF